MRYLAVLALAASSAFADPALLNLLPSDAKVIGGVHVDRTLASPMGQYVLSRMKADDPNFRRLVEQTGFDPRRDLRDVVMASNTTPGGGKGSGVVIARGVFNGPQIAQAAAAHGGKQTTYRGITLIQPDAGHSIAIIEGSLGIAGDDALVRAVIDARAAGTSTGSALARKALAIESRYDAWFVATGAFMPAATPRPNTPAPPTAALAGIQETSGGVQFGNLVTVNSEAVTRSEKDAQSLVDVINFLTGMMRMNNSNPDMQRFEPVLNSMKVATSGTSVTVSFAVPQADLEQLMTPRKTVRRAAAR